MDNVDNTLQHYGVLGMKWGKRKGKLTNNPVDKAVRALQTKRFRKDRPNPVDKALRSMVDKSNKKKSAAAAKYHDKNKNKGVYKKLYSKNLKRFEGKHDDAHTKAVIETRRQIGKTKALLAVGAMVAARSAYQKTVTPENIKRGKNVILAAKRSPIRYTDASKYKDVIDM